MVQREFGTGEYVAYFLRRPPFRMVRWCRLCASVLAVCRDFLRDGCIEVDCVGVACGVEFCYRVWVTVMNAGDVIVALRLTGNVACVAAGCVVVMMSWPRSMKAVAPRLR